MIRVGFYIFGQTTTEAMLCQVYQTRKHMMSMSWHGDADFNHLGKVLTSRFSCYKITIFPFSVGKYLILTLRLCKYPIVIFYAIFLVSMHIFLEMLLIRRLFFLISLLFCQGHFACFISLVPHHFVTSNPQDVSLLRAGTSSVLFTPIFSA